jgi:chromosome segregation ATPase
MSLFGKLLAIFNVIAAIAFFVVAILDWSQRQAWEHAVFRETLLIDGLPLDENETNADGKQIVKLLDAKILSDVFSTAGANPQSTQVLEVKRVQGIVQGWVNSAPSGAEVTELRDQLVPALTEQGQRLGRQITQTDREIALENQDKKRPDILAGLAKLQQELQNKLAKVNDTLKSLNAQDDKTTQILNAIFRERRLAQVLLPFASTSVEYEDLVLRLSNTEWERDLGALQAKLDNVFNAALTGDISSDEKIKGEAAAPASHKLNIEERKLAVVRVLYGLIGVVPGTGYTAGGPGLVRVVAVCGLSNTFRGIDIETRRLIKMSEDLTEAVVRDVSEFVVEHNRQMVLNQDLADELRRKKQFLQAQQDLIERQITLVNGLNLEIDQPKPPSPTQPLPLGLKQRIDATKNDVQFYLDQQTKMEQSLFNARKQLRDLGDQNRKLEQMIRELEEKAKSR